MTPKIWEIYEQLSVVSIIDGGVFTIIDASRSATPRVVKLVLAT